VLPSLALVQQHPIVHAILGLAGSAKSLGEQVSQEVVVGSLGESELPDVVEVDGKLLCMVKARSRNRISGHIEKRTTGRRE
jgi:hypothetical protein